MMVALNQIRDPRNQATTSSPASRTWCLNGSGELFDVVAGEILYRDAGGAGEPKGIDQALDAPLADPAIDGLAGHTADSRRRTRATGKPDCRGHQVGSGYPFPSHPRSPVASTEAGRLGCLSIVDDINSNRTVISSDHQTPSMVQVKG